MNRERPPDRESSPSTLCTRPARPLNDFRMPTGASKARIRRGREDNRILHSRQRRVKPLGKPGSNDQPPAPGPVGTAGPSSKNRKSVRSDSRFGHRCTELGARPSRWAKGRTPSPLASKRWRIACHSASPRGSRSLFRLTADPSCVLPRRPTARLAKISTAKWRDGEERRFFTAYARFSPGFTFNETPPGPPRSARRPR